MKNLQLDLQLDLQVAAGHTHAQPSTAVTLFLSKCLVQVDLSTFAMDEAARFGVLLRRYRR
jgi:hypothetical protein